MIHKKIKLFLIAFLLGIIAFGVYFYFFQTTEDVPLSKGNIAEKLLDRDAEQNTGEVFSDLGENNKDEELGSSIISNSADIEVTKESLPPIDSNNVYKDNDVDFSSKKEESIAPIEIAPDYRNVETLILRLIPDHRESSITKIIEESDGRDGTLAFVEPDSDDGSVWLMAYDHKDTYNSKKEYRDVDELITTIIHEYSHILSLNNTQVDHIQSDWIECNKHYIIVDEGCAKPDSYITAFSNKFWSEELRDAAWEASEGGEEASEDFATENYEENPDDFVSEYAATNEAEDFAETFALFVTSSYPGGVSLTDEKMKFFYSYPELVELRTYMRKATVEIKSSL